VGSAVEQLEKAHVELHRRNESLRQKTRSIYLIDRVLTLDASTDDPRQLADGLLSLVGDDMHAQRCSLMLRTPDGESLYIAAARGIAPGIMEGTRVALGILPVGTANDFARQVGISDDLNAAMDVVLRRRPVVIDTAAMNGRRFLNVSSGGIGAEATAETPADAKASLGPVAYFISGLRKLAGFEPRRALFEAPGFKLQHDFLLFAVGNARATGGGTLVTPRASVRDGLLDVCIVGAMPRKEFARLVLRVKRGEHLESEGVHYMQVPWIRITAAQPMTVTLDGEPAELRQAYYQVRPRDLLIHLPRLPGHRRSVERDVPA
jgi:YegS/Rv2252/BmrU family lipid kinase